jgi:hypothetical protein
MTRGTSGGSNISTLDVPVLPFATRSRTLLQDNIVKSNIFSDGTMRYDHLGRGATQEPQNLIEASGDEKWK